MPDDPIDQTRDMPVPRHPRSLTLVLPDGERVALSGQRALTIGSHRCADVRIREPSVSRRHAHLRPTSNGWVIRDLESRNGTFMDGSRVDRAWLERSATLRFGAVAVRLEAGSDGGDAIGTHPTFVAAMQTLERLARFRHPVAIRGETGTGKDVAARHLHRCSPRSLSPFEAVNCASIAATLAESELFGHERGAFTGANRVHMGAFERADGGTLFLDEVGELPLALQAKLLRVLETGTITRVGGERAISVDVRIVSATHRDLEAMVERGELREDLYHRLGVLTVALPALRDRPSDIPALLAHFARGLELELGLRVRLTEAAVRAAQVHPWPGNVRALRNALTRAAALSDGPITATALLGDVPTRDAGPLIAVPRGTYAEMSRALMERVVDEEGSLRRAAVALDVPRSTLHNWLRD